MRCVLLILLALLASARFADACSVCEALAAPSCHMMASDAPDAPIARFSLSGHQWPQPGGDGTPVTITYSFNNFLDGGLKDPDGVPVPADYLRLVTEEAFGLWASVAPLNFVEVPDVGSEPFTSFNAGYRALPEDGYGQIRINHRFINGTDAENGFPTTKAMAFFPTNFNNPISGDIHFDNGDPWAVVGTPSEPDVLGILTHEIGHSLGIAHSTIDGTVMFPAALRRNGPGTGILLPDDIAALRAIYGAGIGSVTPLIPEPACLVLGLLATLGWLPARRRAG
ncbi:MAG: matrixin family metalloprotease [Planctomycetota bacterium]